MRNKKTILPTSKTKERNLNKVTYGKHTVLGVVRSSQENDILRMEGLSVADPDPGSGAFLTPGSRIRNRSFSNPGSRIPDPKPIFLRAL